MLTNSQLAGPQQPLALSLLSSFEIREIVNKALLCVHRAPARTARIPARQFAESIARQIDGPASRCGKRNLQEALVDCVKQVKYGFINDIRYCRPRKFFGSITAGRISPALCNGGFRAGLELAVTASNSGVPNPLDKYSREFLYFRSRHIILPTEFGSARRFQCS